MKQNLINPIEFIYETNYLPSLDINRDDPNAILISIAISDIHFGAIDPEYQFETLKNQFIDKLYTTKFDIMYINGDLFDRKFMGDSDAILYATLFVDECVRLCRVKNATLVLLSGTESHDGDQYKLFYHYLSDPTIDIRIVENTRFEYIKGQRVLCIPEEYNKGEEYYNRFLRQSGIYDAVILHGMLRGAVYEDNSSGLDSSRAPTFDLSDFVNCRGYILSGHVHTPGVFGGYFYYSGSPYRWQHGEEEDKGFLVILSNIATGAHYPHFEVIHSLKYITVDVDYLIDEDPDKIIEELNRIKIEQDIYHLRIKISSLPSNKDSSTIGILKNYFRNKSDYKVHDITSANKSKDREKEYIDKYQEYNYIFSDLNPYEILSKYINQKEDHFYISTDDLIKMLSEEI